MPVLRDWTLKENKWRATRYGDEARFIRNERGDEIPVDEHIRLWLEHLTPVARRLNCEAELMDVAKILDHGASYRRQRRMLQERESFQLVVDELIAELRDDRLYGT